MYREFSSPTNIPDHTRGVEVLSRKHRIPVYLSSSTMLKRHAMVEPELCKDLYHS